MDTARLKRRPHITSSSSCYLCTAVAHCSDRDTALLRCSVVTTKMFFFLTIVLHINHSFLKRVSFSFTCLFPGEVRILIPGGFSIQHSLNMLYIQTWLCRKMLFTRLRCVNIGGKHGTQSKKYKRHVK